MEPAQQQKMVPTEDGGHIPARYGEFVEILNKEPETLAPHRSIHAASDMEPSNNFPYGRIYNFSKLGGAISTQLRRL
jgi:hypothetical protein